MEGYGDEVLRKDGRGRNEDGQKREKEGKSQPIVPPPPNPDVSPSIPPPKYPLP